MAARLNLRQDEQSRAAIQTTQLVKRLQANGLGQITPELSASQVKSIEILLRKRLPDLQSIALGNDGDSALIVKIIRQTPDA